MKRLEIKSRHYQEVEKKFKEWLQTLGYSLSTINGLPVYARELFFYLEQKGKTEIQQATEGDISGFFSQWKKRKNQNTGAGLSDSHIRNGTLAFNKLLKYLRLTGQHHIETNLQLEKSRVAARVILTKKEIKSLYEATYQSDKRTNPEAFGQRDRAMLEIYYGCGLRKNEGSFLDAGDILLDQRLVFVRKGKGGKERYVPITDRGISEIKEYLNYGRPWFLEKRQKPSVPATEAFFVNIFGERMRAFYQRIKLLKEQSGITKAIGTHTFRHSIATHLLQSGMTLEMISKFLGHSSLESTQLYTHIANEPTHRGIYPVPERKAVSRKHNQTLPAKPAIYNTME